MEIIKDALLEVTKYATEHDEKGERLPLTLNKDEVKTYWEQWREDSKKDEE